MVSKGKKMKISISIRQEEKEYLDLLVKSGAAASMSHAVRICILSHMLMDSKYKARERVDGVRR